MRRNVPRENILEGDNKHDEQWCTVRGYDWGTDTNKLKSYSPFLRVANLFSLNNEYDILFLADLLWYTSAHEAVLDSIVALLGVNGKAWIGCGEYTTLETCEGFMALAEKRGLDSPRVELEDGWQGIKRAH